MATDKTLIRIKPKPKSTGQQLTENVITAGLVCILLSTAFVGRRVYLRWTAANQAQRTEAQAIEQHQTQLLEQILQELK